jgi:hypothetical protein
MVNRMNIMMNDLNDERQSAVNPIDRFTSHSPPAGII